MKKSLIGLAALCVAGVTSVALGAPAPCPAGTESVQLGDTLWGLNGPGWRQLLTLNADLNDPRRWDESPNGTIVVKIWETDCLKGVLRTPTGLLVPRQGEPAASKPLTRQDVETPQPQPQPPIAATPWWSLDWLKWWLVLLAIVLIAWFIYSSLHADAARAGNPIVAGGVSVTTAPQQFQAVAAQRHLEATGISIPAQQFQIIDMAAGRGYGLIGVNYRHSLLPTPRILNGDWLFRALIERSDGTRELMYMLQQCGNDLRYDGVSRYIPGPGFRFVPDEVAAPAPVAPAAPVQQAPVAEAATPAGAMPAATAVSPETDAILRWLEGGAATAPPVQRPGSPPQMRVEVRPATTGHPTPQITITGLLGATRPVNLVIG